MIIDILQIIAGVATILTGVVSLFWPRAVRGFTGLTPEGGRGITEIRAILGALFIGLGAAVILLDNPSAYLTLGIAYLTVAVVRFVSMFVDKSVERSNIISFVAEVVLGVILIL